MDYFVYFGFGYADGGAHADDGAGESEYQAVVSEALVEAVGDAVGGVEWLLGFAVFDEFDGGEEAGASDVAHGGVVAHHAFELFLEVGADAGGVFDHVLGFDNLDVLEGGGGGDGVSAGGQGVSEVVVFSGEDGGDFFGGYGGCQGEV